MRRGFLPGESRLKRQPSSNNEEKSPRDVLLERIRNNDPGVESLIFSFKITEDDFLQLSKALNKNHQITYLELDGTGLSDDRLAVLELCLTNNHTLRAINFNEDKITFEQYLKFRDSRKSQGCSVTFSRENYQDFIRDSLEDKNDWQIEFDAEIAENREILSKFTIKSDTDVEIATADLRDLKISHLTVEKLNLTLLNLYLRALNKVTILYKLWILAQLI